ncbi:MAG: response regulator [Pirellulales bacterium]
MSSTTTRRRDESVAALVESMEVPCATFASTEEFLEKYRSDYRGCVVSDLRMRGASGLDLLKTLRAKGVSMPVIIISGYADVPATVQMFQAGAWTLLQKPCRDQELWDTIRAAPAHDAKQEEYDKVRADVQARLRKLTPEESRILRMVLKGKSNKVVASRMDIGLRTVEARRHAIMTKMQTASLVELARLLYEVKLDQDLGGDD